MDPRVTPLIATLRSAITFIETRTTPDRNDYFEAILSRPDLERCAGLVRDAFGPPVKPFNQTVTFAKELKSVVTGLGGVRVEQCLFLRPGAKGEPVAYAAFWPWASNPQRITLKVGLATP